MGEKKILSIKLIDDSDGNVALTSLTKNAINLLRTDSGATDGTVYFNGKEYFTMKEMERHLLKRDGVRVLTPAQKNNVYTNIGWKDESITVTISCDSHSEYAFNKAGVTLKYDEVSRRYPWLGIPITFTIPMYTDYKLVFDEVDRFAAPSEITGYALRDHSTTHNVSYTFTGSTSTYDDLSYLDINGNGLTGGRETANCYVIHAAGRYEIPMVYGNSIEEGKVNTSAFISDTGGKNFVAFKNYYGNTITTHIINDDYGSNRAIYGTVLWIDDDTEQFNITVDAIEYDENDQFDKLRFTVNSLPTSAANAVLAAWNAAGDIVWSWHLWYCPDTIGAKQYTTTTSIQYEMIDRNLGWVEHSQYGPSYGCAPTYQWGRKDPMCRGDVYHISPSGVMRIRTLEQPLNVACKGINFASTFFGDNETAYGVWNEECLNTPLINYWNNDVSNVIGTDNDIEVKKTIYDPCPAEYHVPVSAAFRDFTEKTVDPLYPWDNGYMWNDVYFHASGYRTYNNGEWVYGNDVCLYATSILNDAVSVKALSFSKDEIAIKGAIQQSIGFTVRPFKRMS